MPGSNAIGTGAVVLTANADQLLAGLDRAQTETTKRVGNIGKSAAKAANAGGKGGGGKGGGIFGAVLFGTGGPLAALGAAKAGLAMLDRFANIEDVSKKYSNVDVDRQMQITRAQKGMDRIAAVFDDFLLSAGVKLTPLIEKVASVLEVVGFVGSEVFGKIVDWVGEIVTDISKWVDETFGLATATTSAGDQAFAVLRLLGKGVAYFWDLNKGAAGAVAYVAGAVVDGFGQVVQVIGQAIQKLDELAKTLPEVIRPDWVGKAGAAVEGWGKKVEAIGAGMNKWGKDAVLGFGNSANAVDAWFNAIEAKFKTTDKLAKSFGQILSGAFAQGSSEAYSVIAKFTAGNIVTGQQPADNPLAVAKKQLDQAKEIKRGTWRIVGELAKGTTVKVANE